MTRLAVGVLIGLTGLAFAAGDGGRRRAGLQAPPRRQLHPRHLVPRRLRQGLEALGRRRPPSRPITTAAFREPYGLHPAPYPNGDLPMGLRDGPRLLRQGRRHRLPRLPRRLDPRARVTSAWATPSLDVQALFEDLNAGSGLPSQLPFRFSNVRGTSEAGGFRGLPARTPQPGPDLPPPRLDLDLHDQMCEDVPAWWLLQKKKTMYHTGEADARSVRSLMQFMMSPLNGPAAFEKAEPDFADIQQYLYSLRPPKYPFPIDRPLAAKGEAIFSEDLRPLPRHLRRELDLSEQDRPARRDRHRPGAVPRHHGEVRPLLQPELVRPGRAGQRRGVQIRSRTAGYQAPPLDGIWATAPYFHNGSAPTVYHVLNSKARPKRFTRSYRTAAEDYDPVKLGWKYREVGPVDPKLPARERRKVYDTTQPGRGNGGHTFGDDLTDEQRMAVIEYLKTI